MLKSFSSQIMALSPRRSSRRNLGILLRFLAVLAGLIATYSVMFHLLMLREGQDHTWLTGLYWTLTVMSTLGFGDITFHTDLGRGFSILVLLSGMLFMLVLLPFTFIEFFYEPWMRAQAAGRTPRDVDPETRDHVLMTNYGPMAAALIRRCALYRIQYVVLVESAEMALALQDEGVNVVVGDLDDPDTYRRVRVDQAALVVATASDVINTSVAFTVRELARKVRIVATAQSEASVDILELAGCNDVLRPEEIVGEWFARRMRKDAAAHVIGNMDRVLVAEASADGTPLIGKTLAESQLRETTGVSVAGLYVRGRFEAAQPGARICKGSILVLTASKESLARFQEEFTVPQGDPRPVLILGGGRVGRATARAVAKRGHDYRVVEKDPNQIRPGGRYLLGDAAKYEVLQEAGIKETGSIVITTHDDDLNVYLTLYCRRLRPEAQIIARATSERHVATLHRAGADYVVSYASTAVGAILNIMRERQIVQVGEGLDFFRVSVPPALAGRSVGESRIREQTGCTIVAVTVDGTMRPIRGPDEILLADAEVMLVGAVEDQERFLSQFSSS